MLKNKYNMRIKQIQGKSAQVVDEYSRKDLWIEASTRQYFQ